jgi:hypothetical protein
MSWPTAGTTCERAGVGETRRIEAPATYRAGAIIVTVFSAIPEER